jgi:hypothetical protein
MFIATVTACPYDKKHENKAIYMFTTITYSQTWKKAFTMVTYKSSVYVN